MRLNDSSIMPVLAVDDIERAKAFYRDRLGLTVREDAQMPDSLVVELGSGGYLFLYKTAFKRGENTVASFLVDDVAATVRELRDRGITFAEYDLPGLKTENGVASLGDLGQSAWFSDSEGNTIAISTDIRRYLSKAA